MSKIYANPFFWGEPSRGAHYLQRTEEQEFIAAALEKQLHLIISGYRGTGKTSLLKYVLRRSPSASIYLDLSFVVSRADLANLLLEALENGFPEVKESGQTKLLRENDHDTTLSPVFDLWYKLVKQSNQKFTIAWDEFQHLVKLKDGIIGELRENLRDRRGITHVIVSHREDIMHEILDNNSNPFFSRHEHLVINNLDLIAFNRFLTQRFRRMGLSDFDLADSVLKFTNGQAQLTQKVAHSLAQLWLEGNTTRLLERTIIKMLKEHNVIFASDWDNFGLNEKRLLIGLSRGNSHPTELSFIREFGLSATSTAHNTVLKLLREGWLISRDEGYYIYDPLFLRWLQNGGGLS
ncbi:AAA family ATPase [bacterium]|nr:AAA family ATPase [bacterium]